MIETLADVELVLRARSSDKLIIFDTFTPGAGSNSYRLTTGPLLIFVILPSIPKSNNIFSINWASGLFLNWSKRLILEVFLSNKSTEGNLKFSKLVCFTCIDVGILFFSKTKACWGASFNCSSSIKLSICLSTVYNSLI